MITVRQVEMPFTQPSACSMWWSSANGQERKHVDGTNIRNILELISAVNADRLVEFSPKTRDRAVPVYRDELTGVIFIDDFYVGDDEYRSGDQQATTRAQSFEDAQDTERRARDFSSFYFGKSVLDFGCGSGSFLRAIRDKASDVRGVELQVAHQKSLQLEGIPCESSVPSNLSGVDVAFMFHVLEHLPEPLEVLRSLRSLLESKNGVLVVEVPHARDFLITGLKSQAFIDFTLWSQHLVLHTRDSLASLLRFAGFGEVSVYGVQRYSLANHLHWLSAGEPGGHRGPLSQVVTKDLESAYEQALARQDATDTLIAVAACRNTLT